MGSSLSTKHLGCENPTGGNARRCFCAVPRGTLLAALLLLFPLLAPAVVANDGAPEVSARQIASRVSVTGPERAWLEGHRKVRFRVGRAPPFHMWDEGAKGISVDYAKLFCLGYQLECEFVTGIPWPKAVESLSRGQEFDVILTIKHSKERERQVLFTSDYLVLPWVIFSRLDAAPLTGISDLRGRRVSVERGYLIHELLSAQDPEISFLVTDDTQQAIEALSKGLVEAYVGNLTVGTFISNQAGYNNIKVAAPTTLGDHTQAMAVRPDWPALASLLDRFLQAMTDEEKQILISPWLTVRFEYGVDWPFVWRVIGIILLVSLTLVLAFWYWNRRLQNEISQREIAQQEAARKTALLSCIDNLRTSFINEPDPIKLFPRFLDDLLELTRSEFGLVGDVLYDGSGSPYLKLYGLSDIAWDGESSRDYEEYRRHGFEFRNLENLFGRVVTTGQAVISDHPETDPRSAGFPAGHPKISNFLGIPSTLATGWWARSDSPIGRVATTGNYWKRCPR
jgi:ABC-type amino acid transport substrate-binding protein